MVRMTAWLSGDVLILIPGSIYDANKQLELTDRARNDFLKMVHGLGSLKSYRIVSSHSPGWRPSLGEGRWELFRWPAYEGWRNPIGSTRAWVHRPAAEMRYEDRR